MRKYAVVFVHGLAKKPPPEKLEEIWRWGLSRVDPQQSVAFSPDSAVLAIGTNGPERKGVEFYDVKSGQRRSDQRDGSLSDGASVRRVVFNATGNTLATGTDSVYAQLWSLDTPDCKFVELADRQTGSAKTYTWAIAFDAGALGEEVVTGSYTEVTPEIRFRNKMGAGLLQPTWPGRNRMLAMAVDGDRLLEGGADGGSALKRRQLQLLLRRGSAQGRRGPCGGLRRQRLYELRYLGEACGSPSSTLALSAN